MTRRKFTPKFKAKVVLEALQERRSLTELGQKYKLHPNQIARWKQDLVSRLDSVFEQPGKSKKTEAEERETQLLKTIGQLKVELDFLKNALRYLSPTEGR